MRTIQQRVTRMLAVVCAVALVASTAAAQQGQGQQAQQQRQQQQRQQQQRQQRQAQQRQQQDQQAQRIATVRGRVQDVRRINLAGQQQPHVLAKIELSDGRTVVADLGTLEDARRLQPRKGQSLSVMGRPGRINGRPIIVADRARNESRPDAAITIVRIVPVEIVPAQQQPRQRGPSPAQLRNRADQYRQMANQARQQGNEQRAMRYQQQARRFDALASRYANQQQPQQRQGRQFRADQPSRQQRQQQQQMANPVRFVVGQITDARDLQLRGVPDSHKLVKLQTDQGRTVIVDLGRQQDLQDVKLTKGERVAAIGVLGRINGKPVLFATHAADMIAVNRQSGQQQQQQFPGEAQTAGARQSPDQQQQQGQPQRQQRSGQGQGQGSQQQQ